MAPNDAAIQQQLIDALNRFSDSPPAGQTGADGQATITGDGPARGGKPCYRFATGDVRWVFPVEQKAEVFMDLEVAPVPGAPSTLAGLCQVRGQIAPVYCIHARLGMTPPARPAVLMFYLDDGALGLITDAPPQKQSVYQPVAEPDPGDRRTAVLNTLVNGVYPEAECPLWSLSPGKLGPGLRAMAMDWQPTDRTPGCVAPAADSEMP